MSAVALQRCNKCMQMLCITAFRVVTGKNGQSYAQTVCKSCNTKRDEARKRGYRRRALANPVQACRCCGQVKPKDAFRPLRDAGDGLWVRAKTCEACEAKSSKRRHVATVEVDDLVPAYYPDPLHAVARDWRGPVNPAPLLGLLSLPMPEAEWRMAA